MSCNYTQKKTLETEIISGSSYLTVPVTGKLPLVCDYMSQICINVSKIKKLGMGRGQQLVPRFLSQVTVLLLKV